jgi:glycosyltransferase involved in cell wall biosynthesis
MRILTIHNKYRIRGGEDESRESEDALLRQRGHEVRELVFDNSRIEGASIISAAISATWSSSSYKLAHHAISTWHPDILDVHNFFPLASPSVHYAAHSLGVPVVQTLHNYRLMCPGAALLREGAVCEMCLGKTVPWHAMVHRCYRGSALGSAAVTTMIAAHSLLGTWTKCVTVFVALTQFARQKFIQAGFPADKIVVKANFVPQDLGPGRGDGGFILYVGRLSEEKGVRTLLDAWEKVKTGKLVLAGAGPLEDLVRERAGRFPSIQYAGRLLLQEVYELMGRASALVFPSLWYEGMPRVIIESLCRGTPVIASRLGSMLEMVAEGETGWFAEPGDPSGLATSMSRALSDQWDVARVRCAARGEFLAKYTPERNGERMEQIYARAIEEARSRAAEVEQTA